MKHYQPFLKCQHDGRERLLVATFRLGESNTTWALLTCGAHSRPEVVLADAVLVPLLEMLRDTKEDPR